MRIWRSSHPFRAIEVRGVLVTGVPRTLVDCAAVLEEEALAHLVDRAVVVHRLDVVRMMRSLQRLDPGGKRPGVRALRAHLERRNATGVPTPSVLERHLLHRLDEAGLPARVREHWVTIDGEPYRVDAAYPDLLLAYEVDGHAYHSSPEQTRRDHRRRGLLLDAGWSLQVLMWHDVATSNPAVLARLRRSFDLAVIRAEAHRQRAVRPA